MAEVFGVIAGAAGLVTAFKELNKGLGVLLEARRQLEDAPRELDSLTAELQFLTDLVEILIPREQAIKTKYPSGESILRHCVGSCQEVLTMLQALQKRHSEALTSKRRKPLSKLSTFRNWKEDVKALHDKIVGVKQNLTLISGLGTFQNIQVEELFVVAQTQRQHPTSQTDAEQTMNALAIEHSSTTVAQPNSSEAQFIETFNLRYVRRRQMNCFNQACPCSCHRTRRGYGSFWTFQYTPLEFIRQPCDFKLCTGTDYGFNVRLDFSPLGLLWAADIQLRVFAASGGMSIRPPLAVRRVVPSDSLGFAIIRDLFRYQSDDTILIQNESEVKKAKNKLKEISRTDPSFNRHETREGENYLEHLLEHGGYYMQRGEKTTSDLFKFMLVDLGLLGSANLPRLLHAALRTGAFPHDYEDESNRNHAVNLLLDVGMDPADADGADGDWGNEPDPPTRPDKHLKKYSRLSPGFKQMTPLHEAILLEQPHPVVSHWIERCAPDERNAYGQTPLHLAVAQPDRVTQLINAGHDVNSLDYLGRSPLDYTVLESRQRLSEQVEETVTILVTYGGSIDFSMEFSVWKSIQGLDNVAIAVCLVHALQANGKDHTAMIVASLVLCYALCRGTQGLLDPPKLSRVHIQEKTALDYLLKFLPSLFLPPHGRHHRVESLLEYVASEEQLRILAQHFDLPNHLNLLNQGTLSRIISFSNLGLHLPPMSSVSGMIKALIDYGVDVNRQDHWHHTLLYHTLVAIHNDLFFHGAWSLMLVSENHMQFLAAVAMLLERGADPFSADQCRCPCSPVGCIPVSATGSISESYGSMYFFVLPMATISCLQMVWDYRGPHEARRFLLLIVRRATHQELDMAHVCCFRDGEKNLDRESPTMVLSEDIDDILEEEDVFTRMLDEEMGNLQHATWDELIDLWFSKVKARFYKWCAGVSIPQGRECELELRTCGKPSIAQGPGFWEALPMSMKRQVSNSISNQVLAFYMKSACAPSVNPSPHHPDCPRWCTRAYTHLLQLIKVLEIPQGAIFETLKRNPRYPSIIVLTTLDWDEIPERFVQDMDHLDDKTISCSTNYQVAGR